MPLMCRECADLSFVCASAAAARERERSFRFIFLHRRRRRRRRPSRCIFTKRFELVYIHRAWMLRLCG